MFLLYGSVLTTVAKLLWNCIISSIYTVIYKYYVEVFPTVVRSSAVAFGTTCKQTSVAAPLILLLGYFVGYFDSTFSTKSKITSLIFGSFAFLLPETRGRNLSAISKNGERFNLMIIALQVVKVFVLENGRLNCLKPSNVPKNS